MDKEILSAQDVATLLNLSEQTVRRLFRDGEIPGRRVGKAWFTTRRQLLDHIELDVEEPIEIITPPDSQEDDPSPVDLAPLFTDEPIGLSALFPAARNMWACNCGYLNRARHASCRECGAEQPQERTGS